MLTEYGIRPPDDLSTSSLGTSIANIIQDKTRLQKQLEIQKPVLKSSMIFRLIRGEHVSTEELALYFPEFGATPDKNPYVCLILHVFNNAAVVDSLHNRRILSLLIKDDVLSKHSECVTGVEIDSERMVLIVYSHTGHDKPLKMAANRVLETMNNAVGPLKDINFNLYGGDEVTGSGDIFRSYQQAAHASNYPALGKDAICWYSDFSKLDTLYYFPIELESHLLSGMRTGQVDYITKIIDSLYTENFCNRKLNAFMLSHLIHEFRSIVTKVGLQLEDKEYTQEIFQAIENSDHGQGIAQTWALLRQISIELAVYSNRKKRSHNTQLINKIVIYIQEHYPDPNLSLTSIADEFGISETYLSSFFKEQTGEKFYKYLTSCRMNKASEYLAQSSLSIHEIGVQVGYMNRNTFQKAFSRWFSEAPSQHRKSRYNSVQGE
jgi:YesN/AraC family two-component response regulator